MDIKKIVEEIIPPADYEHRNGFNNIPLIEKLNREERKEVEDILIHRLLFESDQQIDNLIIETLAYLKSLKSLPILHKILTDLSDNDITKLVVASSIFEINREAAMIDIAAKIVKELDNKADAYYTYKLTSAFYYLTRFKSEKLNALLRKYSDSDEYLLAFNAKQALKKSMS